MKKLFLLPSTLFCVILLSVLVSCVGTEKVTPSMSSMSESGTEMTPSKTQASATQEPSKQPDPDKEYVVYNIGGYYCISGANQVCELSKAEQDLYFDRDDVYEEEIAKNLTVTLDGEEYVCQYYKTYRKGISDDWHAFYEYRCDGIDFYIDPQSGAIIGFLRPGLKADGDRLSMAECRANAYAYASKKIEDFDNYLLVHEYTNSSTGIHGFKFARYANGIPTCDQVKITTLYDGTIVSFRTYHYDLMKDYEGISDEEKAKINQAVKDKVTAIYAEVAHQFTFKTDSVEKTIIVLPDGKTVMEYEITLQLKLNPGYEIGLPVDQFEEVTHLWAMLD